MILWTVDFLSLLGSSLIIHKIVIFSSFNSLKKTVALFIGWLIGYLYANLIKFAFLLFNLLVLLLVWFQMVFN